MDFTKYTGGTKIYVNVDTGNDTTGNGLEGTPYKTLGKCFIVARDGADSKYEIVVLNSTPFMRDECNMVVTLTNKIVAITPQNFANQILITNAQRSLSWVVHSGSVYKVTRSTTLAVFDSSIKDADGVYIPLLNVATLEECEAASGTWYTDNTTLYVNPYAGSLGSAYFWASIGTNSTGTTLLGTSALYFKNTTFAVSTIATIDDAFAVSGDITGATVVGELCLNNCRLSGGRMKTINELGNVVSCKDVKNVFLFNTVASYAKRDCFNYHYAEMTLAQANTCLVIECNCIGRYAGFGNAENNNNITTAHEGTNIIRMGCVGDNASVPCIDINGCYSIVIDCNMTGARYTDGTYKFSSDNENGKAYVINSKTDADPVGLNALIDTFVYDFQGNAEDTGFQHIII
jgi:hypothetical protein